MTESENCWRELKLLHNIKYNNLDGARYELRVMNKKSGVESSINDVGFGVSQFLPVIVGDLQLDQTGTMFVAQPEIHLHPSIQANLGNYFVDESNNGKQYIIETHSEYLLNRIRLLIVEGKISEEDVNLFFVKNNGKKSEVVKIDLLKNGIMKNAPKEFFETYMMDSMEITLKS